MQNYLAHLIEKIPSFKTAKIKKSIGTSGTFSPFKPTLKQVKTAPKRKLFARNRAFAKK